MCIQRFLREGTVENVFFKIFFHCEFISFFKGEPFRSGRSFFNSAAHLRPLLLLDTSDKTPAKKNTEHKRYVI